VDSAQYIKRRDEYDFEMMISGWSQSFSPGNEQRYFWSSEAADVSGNYNYAGIKNPAVDILIEQIIEAEDFEHLKASVRALDRILLWNHYVMPNWHFKYFRIAYWNKFGRPEENPDFTVPYTTTWWIDPSLELNN
jgi:microcin C transport system substrate-binding protein